MGMISIYADQDIEVLNKEALTKLESHENNLGVISDGVIDFCEWDGYKIEGYWYKDTVNFLCAIAPHIKGWAEFRYE